MSNGINQPTIFDRVKADRKPAHGRSGGGAVGIDDGDAYPHLLSILCDLPKGAVKGAKTGRIGFYLYNGKLSVAVNVPSMRTCGFFTLGGFTDALARLETAIADGKVDWREDK